MGKKFHLLILLLPTAQCAMPVTLTTLMTGVSSMPLSMLCRLFWPLRNDGEMSVAVRLLPPVPWALTYPAAWRLQSPLEKDSKKHARDSCVQRYAAHSGRLQGR